MFPVFAFAAPLYGVTWELRDDTTRKKDECAKGADATMIESSKVFDYCACTSRIVYPQMSGLRPDILKAINSSLRAQIDKDSCGGGPLYTPQAGRSGDKVKTRFDVSYAGERFISFLLWHDSYATGAAHNLWSAEGATYDVTTGRHLALGDLVSAAKLPEINARISSSLEAAYPGHVAPAPEQPLADARNTAEVKEAVQKEHDAPTVDATNAAAKPTPPMPGKPVEYLSAEGCKGCTYHLTPEGLEIVFQLYEVASFAEGNPKVTLGREYLKPEIGEAM